MTKRRPIHNKSGPIPSIQREAAKQTILEMLSRTNVIQAAIDHAGITRTTYDNWVNSGFLSQLELDTAYKRYQDMLRGEIMKRTFVGEEQPLVQNGRIVKDEDGKKITIFKKDNRLLMDLAKRHLPEYQVADKLDITTHGDFGIPTQYMLVIDSRELLPDEWEILSQIAQRIEDKKSQVVEADGPKKLPQPIG
jgi:hypothetical protein